MRSWRTVGNRRRGKRRPGLQIVTYVEGKRVAISKHFGMPNAYWRARAAHRQALATPEQGEKP